MSAEGNAQGVDPGVGRRKVAQIITAAIKRAVPMIEAEGVAGRTFAGLWHAAMSVVMVLLDPHDTVLLLEDRCRGLAGFGPNADADLERVPDDKVAMRRGQIVAAATIFSENFEDAYQEAEAAGLAAWFPECVLDRAVEVLDREWGPWHLKRAMADQAAAVAAGDGVVVDVREPVRTASPATARDAGDRVSERRRPRAVRVRVEADVGSGRPRWAYAMVSTAADGSGLEEFREARAPVAAGVNTARAVLAGAVAAMEAVCADGRGAHVVFETTSSPLLAGVASTTARPASDAAAWARLDALRSAVEIDWRRIPLRDGDDLSVRCQSLLGRVAAAPV